MPHPSRCSVSFALDLRVLVPEYEVDRRIFADTHYEGGYIYRDRLYVAAQPGATKPSDPSKWTIRAGFESQFPSPTEKDLPPVKNMSLTPEGGLTFTMDVATKPDLNPRIDVLLRVTARPWNRRTNRSS